MYKIVLALLALIVCSCESKKKSVEKDSLDSSVGKYVYCSIKGVLHIKNPCYNMFSANSDGQTGEVSVRFVPRAELTRNKLNALCPRCIDDSVYEELVVIIEENEKRAYEDEDSLDTLIEDSPSTWAKDLVL